MKLKGDDGRWNPYLAGGLTGILIIFSVLFTGNYFGASTAFCRLAGIAEKIFVPDHLALIAYFKIYKPVVDWQVMFLIGILIGSFVAAVTSKSFKFQTVPDMWSSHFGKNPYKRAGAAFFGGAVAMFGARMAGG